MRQFYKNNNWLQRLSKVQLARKEEERLENKVLYPEYFKEPDVWYTHTTKDWRGNKLILTLLNRQGERNDSYNIAVNGIQIYFNKKGKLVMNETRWPLVLGFSDSMRFWAKQFIRISSVRMM
jgi:hypothetical protein